MIFKQETSKKEIRVGLIGHQFMGVAHSNAFRNAGIWYDLPCTITMQTVCAKDTKDSLAAFAEKFGWQSYEIDWRQLVARPDIDLVSVAAPGYLHKDMVMEAAKQGKHILCEKPLANSLKDAEEMVQAVENAGVRHCCGFSYRSTPAQALAKEMVAQDYLGDIFQVYARYAQDWPSSPDFPLLWRFDKNLAGSGALGDIGAHSIDAALFITGMDITSVIGQLKTMIKERPLPDGQRNEKKKVTVDDIAQFLCEFENGAAGCFEATRMATGRKNHNFIEVNGEKGSVYWDFEEQNYLYFYDKTKAECEQGFAKINATHDMHPYNGGPWPQGHGIGYSDTFVIEIANFISAVALNREFHPDFFDGLKCQRILNAVERSSLEKQWINL